MARRRWRLKHRSLFTFIQIDSIEGPNDTKYSHLFDLTLYPTLQLGDLRGKVSKLRSGQRVSLFNQPKQELLPGKS